MRTTAGFHDYQADRTVGEPAFELGAREAVLLDERQVLSATASWKTDFARSTPTTGNAAVASCRTPSG